MSKRTTANRYTVRFNNGEFETEHALPLARAERIALRGLSQVGKFNGGYAELVDSVSGEVALGYAIVDDDETEPSSPTCPLHGASCEAWA